MIEKPWWEVYPGRLESELRSLEEAGIEYKRDNKAFEKGILCLHVKMKKTGNLRIIFPDLYPYFRFEVYAPELDLAHHQNPFTKSLCLIGRSTENWHVDDTLAAFLMERLPQVILTGTSDNVTDVEDIEEPQAEPFSDYYSYLLGTAVIVDGEWEIDAGYKSGTLRIGVASLCTILKGAVLEVYDEDGNTLVKSDPRIIRAFSEYELDARWVRLSDSLKTSNPIEQFKHLEEKDPYSYKTKNNRIDVGILKIRAALFPEEIRNWRKLNYGWIFVCSFRQRESWVINQRKS